MNDYLQKVLEKSKRISHFPGKKACDSLEARPLLKVYALASESRGINFKDYGPSKSWLEMEFNL